ncbi:MAG: DUF1622 domain-containing protein [Thermodesulfobacteriota bacterium]|nr:MAG: DUF1622 domain-containing protein [Thermodesulfobacteriota bacterium]
MEQVSGWSELAATGIEALAVLVMVCLITFGTVRWLLNSATTTVAGAYERYRIVLGKTLLLGLELLVAADIIRTVVEMTPQSLALLGGLVVVRTFLGWTLSLDIEGHWPWQGSKKTAPEGRGEKH